jgi:hypothetical protein
MVSNTVAAEPDSEGHAHRENSETSKFALREGGWARRMTMLFFEAISPPKGRF